MKNPFRRHEITTHPVEPEVSHPVISDIDRAGLSLLQSARDERVRQIESDAYRHFHLSDVEREELDLNNYIVEEADKLQSLRKKIQRKENVYYYSRRGRKEAVQVIAAQLVALNVHLKGEDVYNSAMNQLESFRRSSFKNSGQQNGYFVISPLPDLPEIGLVEAEVLDSEARLEQSWQLQFTNGGMIVNHITRNTLNDEAIETKLYELSRSTYNRSAELRATDEAAVTDTDRFFILGLVYETKAVLENRLALKKPPLDTIVKSQQRLSPDEC